MWVSTAASTSSSALAMAAQLLVQRPQPLLQCEEEGLTHPFVSPLVSPLSSPLSSPLGSCLCLPDIGYSRVPDQLVEHQIPPECFQKGPGRKTNPRQQDEQPCQVAPLRRRHGCRRDPLGHGDDAVDRRAGHQTGQGPEVDVGRLEHPPRRDLPEPDDIEGVSQILPAGPYYHEGRLGYRPRRPAPSSASHTRSAWRATAGNSGERSPRHTRSGATSARTPSWPRVRVRLRA